MERYAWKGYIKNGQIEEYKRRHDEIWPEMVELLKKAGISNYTIFNVGDELFGYYECEHGVEYASMIQRGSEIVKKWDVYMQDILDLKKDENTGAQDKLVEVFRLD
jgi:L-rhamnose mutarotase